METKPNQPDADAILAEFIRLDFDPIALANHLGLTPLNLLDFFEREDIAERLDRLTALIARGEQLRESQSRATALAALQRIVEDEQTDPLERRRAAATILRAVAKRRRQPRPQPTTATTPLPERNAQNLSDTQHPTGEDPSDARGDDRANTDHHPRNASAPSASPPRPLRSPRNAPPMTSTGTSTVTAPRHATAQPAGTHPAPRPP